MKVCLDREQHDNSDDCSPFCSCECCTIPTIMENIGVGSIIPENILHKPYYLEGTPSSNPNMVFQPPQILI